MYYTVATTCNNESFAVELAHKIIEERLVACSNIIPNVSSIYLWNGVIEQANEFKIIFKTNEPTLSKLMLRIKELHSYETPMIYACKIEKIDLSYAKWIDTILGA